MHSIINNNYHCLIMYLYYGKKPTRIALGLGKRICVLCIIVGTCFDQKLLLSLKIIKILFMHEYTIFTVSNNLRIFFLQDNNFIARRFKRAKNFKNALPARPTFPRTTRRTYNIMITHCCGSMRSIVFSWIAICAQYIRFVPNMWFAFQCRQKTRSHVFVPSTSFSSVRPLRDIIIYAYTYYFSSRSYFILRLPITMLCIYI